MYPDPKKVRDKRLTMNLSDYEFEDLMAYAGGNQMSAVARDLVMSAVYASLTKGAVDGNQHEESVQRIAA